MDKHTIDSIIKTLCYAEVFSYPLTFSELHTYLISKKKVGKRELLYALSKCKHVLAEKHGFLVFKNCLPLIPQRLQRTHESKRKFAKAIWVGSILSIIPTIKLIGVSGSVSMFNAKKEDDIDLFFVTRKNTLWATRFLVLLILLVLRNKRATKSRLAKDKICPNMFVTEESLQIPKSSQNVYSAHEVAQLKVIYSRGDTYDHFLSKNRWVLKYLPHAFENVKQKTESRKQSIWEHGISFADAIFYISQKIYMRRKITREVITKNKAFFHPLPLKSTIMGIYNLKIAHRRKSLEGAIEHRHISIAQAN